MEFKETSKDILHQLIKLSKGLSESQFSSSLELLSGNSIGKHIRHIIEFYDLMVLSYDSGVVCYDSRRHDLILENNKEFALVKMESLLRDINKIPGDKPLELHISYGLNDKEEIKTIYTSFARELVSNIEHAIHHMAIIKIAILQNYPEITMEENFGVAYSTVRYNQSQCAQ